MPRCLRADTRSGSLRRRHDLDDAGAPVGNIVVATGPAILTVGSGALVPLIGR